MASEALSKELKHIIKGDKYLKSFTLATGVDASIFRYGDIGELEGDDDISSKISVDSCCQNKCKSSAFCSVVHRSEKGSAACAKFRQDASLQCISLGESYITRCHAGLTICFAPLLYDDRCIGAITCGPIIMWDFDDFAKDEARKLAGRLDVNEDNLIIAGELLAKKTSAEVGALADVLFSLAEQLAGKRSHLLTKNLNINYQQARIAELLHKMKQTENMIEVLEDTESPSSYPLSKENELVGLVKTGDRLGAKKILNEILVHVFYHGSGNLDVLKARVLELVVVISRAAVESGAGLSHMLGINYEMIGNFAKIDGFTEICNWVTKTLDEMMGEIYNSRNVKCSSLLSKAMEYIRQHYNEEISLEDVAKQVVVSESYVSHLFGRELGVTFSGYLTKVRMEKAKQLLKTTDLSVFKIAEMVGYDQAGYFSKVFKKHVGTTPGKFRRGDVV